MSRDKSKDLHHQACLIIVNKKGNPNISNLLIDFILIIYYIIISNMSNKKSTNNHILMRMSSAACEVLPLLKI